MPLPIPGAGFRPEITFRRVSLPTRFICLWMIVAGLGGFPAASARVPTPPFLGMPTAGPSTSAVALEPVQPDLFPIDSLVGAIPFPGQGRVVLFSRYGWAHSRPLTPTLDDSVPFLNIAARTAGRGDTGLLSLAFHPDFGKPGSTNREFVYAWYAYTTNQPGDPANPVENTWNRLSRFRVPEGSLKVDPASELVLIEQEDRHLFHAGGTLLFHPGDGFLYLSLGDEGGANDAFNSAQQITRGFFSGVIRLDVDQRGGTVSHPIRHQPERGRTQGYFIPSDNPWVGVPGALEEFYAIGLRNPFRMSVDPVSGDIWIGDVGQDRREEINRLEKGANYQWPFREGTLTGPKDPPEVILGTQRGPVYEYARDGGICIIGGMIYRGREFADLLGGLYVFGDLDGSVFALDLAQPGAMARRIAQFAQTGSLVAISADASGELLFSNFADGRVWRLRRTTGSSSTLPALLSQTGAFADTARLEPEPALLPYSVNSPLWSDGALKRRWMAIPSEGEPTRIEVLPNGEWAFPGGTVFVKHFEIQTNLLDPAAIRRLETRLLVLQTNGEAYGVTYRWRPDGQDAEVLPAGGDEEIVIRTADGAERRQTWHYPSMRECLQCHTRPAGYVLGATALQLNGPLVYPGSTSASNQVAALNALGLFHPAYPEADLAKIPALVNPADTQAPLKTRVRAYLEANCSSCHRPGGVRAQFDARFAAIPEQQNLIYGAVANDLDRPGTRVVVPGDLDRSALYQRLVTLDAHKMPPLGRNTVDPLAQSLFQNWILTIPAPRLSSPAPGSRIEEGPLVLVAEVDYMSSWIQQVEFVVNGVVAGIATAPPYRLELNNLGDGIYQVAAVVRVQDGTRNPGLPIEVEMARGLPTVRLMQPIAGPVFDRDLELEMEAVSAPDTALEQVQLLLDGDIVGTGEGPRLVLRLDRLTPGPHLLQARAVDRNGREGVSTPITVQVVPTPEVNWPGQGTNGVVALIRPNLVGRLGQVYEDPRWQGYWSMLEGIEPGLPDFLGGTEAIRLPTGDLGSVNGAQSGLFYLAEPRLDAGRYLVSVRARAGAENLPIAYGLTDGFTSTFTLGTNWSRLTEVFQYTPCDCYQDERVFQVVESVPQNGGWELSHAEVARVDEVPLVLDLDGRGGVIQRVRARLDDGTELEAIPGQWAFRPPALPSGTYRLQVEVETASGLVYRPGGTTLVVGPRLELAWREEARRHLQIRGVVGSRIQIETSTDLQSWQSGPELTLARPEMEIPEELLNLGASPVRFLRAVLRPLPAPTP